MASSKKRANAEASSEDVEMNPPGVASSSGKDMEKKKKRKAEDKARKRAALENDSGKPSRPITASSESNSDDQETPLPSAAAAAATSVTRTLPELPLNYFSDLASSDASRREEAAASLVIRLQEIQKQYEMIPDKESVDGGLMLEAEKNDGLDSCAPHLRYTLRRLIRGVSSSRECARQGFALGLTLHVSIISSIDVEALLKLVSDSLSVSSSMKGQDVKECLLGRLFAYGAIARSGRLLEHLHIITEFTDAVINLAAKKRYLQEPAVHVLIDFIDKLPLEAVLANVLEAPELRKWFEQATEVGNPDALLLALKLREKISADHPVFTKLLPVPFTSAKFFSSDHLSAISNCLKESTFCQPRVHSLWPLLRDMLLPESIVSLVSSSTPSSSKKRNRKPNPVEEEATNNVRNFCQVFVEGVLLSSSHDRKHLAFDILLLLLPKLPSSFVQYILSFGFVQCLMDILSTKDSWLYKVATHFLAELMDWAKDDDAKRVAVMMSLQRHSEGKFDNITRTKTVKDLSAEFETEDGCTLFLQNLMNLFVDEQNVNSEEPKWGLEPCSVNSDQSQTTDDNSEIGSNEEEKETTTTAGNSDVLKRWVVESLPGVLKHAKLAPEEKLRVQKQILKFLAVQGLFLASLGTEVTSFELQEKFKWPKTATPVAICKMCIEQLQLLLSNSQKMENPLSKGDGLEQPDDDSVSYFMRFLSTLQNIPSVSLFRSLNEADEKAVKELQETETKLAKEERNCGLSVDANKFHALRHLVVQLLLQIFLHPEKFSEAASELSICCEKAFESSLSGEVDEGEGEEPAVMDVLVDTLLSLLPHSSAPMRSSIEQVFKYFCKDVTNDGLLRMLRVIKKDLKPARHREDKDEDDDEDEDCLDIVEDDESEEIGETDDSETVVNMAVDKENSDDDDDGSDDDDDDGMDDDAMFRMDAYLAQIFKEKRNQPGGETALSQLVLFKLRVLSLLEIFLHENSGNPQVMTVYVNLAQAFVNPSTGESSQQLLQRIWGIIQKKIFKAKEIPKDESIELVTLVSLLEKNLRLAGKPFKSKKKKVAGEDDSSFKKKQSAARNRHKMIVNLAQSATHWVLKIVDSRKYSEAELENVLEVFRSVLVRYFDTKKSQMKIEFLEEVFRRRPWVAHRLFGFLLEKSAEAKVEFRRVEALDLITETLRSLVPGREDKREESKKAMKSYVKKVSCLIKELVGKMPEKQARRAQVRKFCGRIFQMVGSMKLGKSLLKELGSDGQKGCESALGDLFLSLKKTES